MSDPHTVGDSIFLAAASLASAVAGVIGGVRASRAAQAKDAADAISAAINADLQRLQRDVLPGLVASAVATAIQMLRDTLTRLEAEHKATREELERLRRYVSDQERDGADRWTETVRAVAKLEATVRNG